MKNAQPNNKVFEEMYRIFLESEKNNEILVNIGKIKGLCYALETLEDKKQSKIKTIEYIKKLIAFYKAETGLDI